MCFYCLIAVVIVQLSVSLPSLSLIHQHSNGHFVKRWEFKLFIFIALLIGLVSSLCWVSLPYKWIKHHARTLGFNEIFCPCALKVLPSGQRDAWLPSVWSVSQWYKLWGSQEGDKLILTEEGVCEASMKEVIFSLWERRPLIGLNIDTGINVHLRRKNGFSRDPKVGA